MGPLGNPVRFTLTFGICCDHPFVNGNKRTALVAMLVHLDKNRRCIHRTKESELYRLMLAIADHTLGLRPDARRPDKRQLRRDPDEEVAAIKTWLASRVAAVKKGERPITFRQLRKVLSRFDVFLENPRSNTIEIIKVEEIRVGLFRRPKKESRRIGTIGYRNEGTEVSFKDLRNLRQACFLTEEHGIDSDAFYDGAEIVDAFINRYRTVLRRLGKV